MTIEHSQRRETPAHTFETPGPIGAFVEIQAGLVNLNAQPTTTTTVHITGRNAEQVEVGFNGNALSVIGPKDRTVFGLRDKGIVVTISLPEHSDVSVRTGSADLSAAGTLGDLRVKTGSGDVILEVLSGGGSIETGSGDFAADEVHGDLQVKTGSGDIVVRRSAGGVSASTGSGDVQLGTSAGPSSVRTGSGDLVVEESLGDLGYSTGSGDLVVRAARRGRVESKGASGDARVGIPAGTPVWTDIHTVSGSIRSGLESVGAPTEGQDHVELRVKTVSGDIELRQV